MNMDPVHHTHEVVPDYEREVIVAEDSSAVSSMMLTMIGIIVAVALIAVVVAIGPWSTNSGRSNTNITPGQGGSDVTPTPSQRLPNQQVNPSQPQIVPTTITSPR